MKYLSLLLVGLVLGTLTGCKTVEETTTATTTTEETRVHTPVVSETRTTRSY